ncbi:tetracycline resistance MFS efflux pump [Youhaiella tibetensis]|uniref:TCR/Tet family MFS transporter n=1 Tax=Paradevosia tibetensis TaxID=1447062 RepID=A0A5B9DQ06_9HYPH|nr:TCR/Tet family MFS transporter [Youhaiella tibetensis]AKR56114.1 Tetracycline efflux protein TetA [Devosia sp. H5989]QEE21166.1 TCR/Tet family MFS transporter [Youhaiella tibetensis]GGF17382.1 tetracycline resistance MFS efflux pump [Youhaiella tibetensis]
MKAETRSRLTLACILITILLDMIGLGIIVPVLPELIEQVTGEGVAQAAVIGGYLVFVYALMQFLFSPVLGNLSDRFGRRPVLLLSLLGLTVDYLFMAFAPIVAFLFVGRILSGIAGAAVATATAYIADITPPEKRSQRFGLIGAAFGLGFIIGPVVGGELGAYGPRVPFYAAAALAFANFLFGFFVLPESLPKERRRKFDIRRANPFGALVALRQYPVVIWLLFALFLLSLASQAFPSVWNFFTIEVVNFSTSQIGRALGAFGIGFALSQAFLIGPMVKRIGEWSTVLIGLTVATIAFVGTAFIHTSFGLYGFLMFGSLSGIAAPAINGLLSRQVPDNAQGELQGAVNAANSLAAILGPLAATQLFAYFTTAEKGEPGYFPGAPFIGAGAMIVLAALVFVYTAWRYDLMHRHPVAKHPKRPDMAPPGQQATPPHADRNGNGDSDVEPEKS